MNPRLRWLSALLVPCLLAVPRAPRADEYADFRIPDHTESGTSASLFGTAERLRNNVSGFTSSSALERNYAGTVGGDGFWIHDSEPVFSRIEGSLATDANRDALSSLDLQFPIFVGEPYMRTAREARDEVARLLGTLDVAWLWYPGSAPLAFGFTAATHTEQDEEWQRLDARSESHGPGFDESSHDQRDSRALTNRYTLHGGAQAGVGRVRDATGVYRARLLEQRLRRRGVLARPLSKGAAARLAALFYVEPEFGDVHERPEKYFAREVERIVREDGALSDHGLDAAAFDLALEPDFGPGAPLGQVHVRRFRGYFVGAVLDARHIHEIHRLDFHEFSTSALDTFPPSSFDVRGSQRLEVEDNLVEAGPSAELHRPLGMRWQFDARTSVALAIPTARIKSGLDEILAGSVGYTIADRWLATASLRHERSYVTPKSPLEIPLDRWSVTYGAAVQYFLEDRTQIQLGASSDESHDRDFLFLGTGYLHELKATLAITYRFTGSLSAPGLFATSRLAPGGAGY